MSNPALRASETTPTQEQITRAVERMARGLDDLAATLRMSPEPDDDEMLGVLRWLAQHSADSAPRVPEETPRAWAREDCTAANLRKHTKPFTDPAIGAALAMADISMNLEDESEPVLPTADAPTAEELQNAISAAIGFRLGEQGVRSLEWLFANLPSLLAADADRQRLRVELERASRPGPCKIENHADGRYCRVHGAAWLHTKRPGTCDFRNWVGVEPSTQGREAIAAARSPEGAPND